MRLRSKGTRYIHKKDVPCGPTPLCRHPLWSSSILLHSTSQRITGYGNVLTIIRKWSAFDHILTLIFDHIVFPMRIAPVLSACHPNLNVIYTYTSFLQGQRDWYDW